jgi:methylmalonyl-CoA/ethylmalonyl-CoA epimerase
MKKVEHLGIAVKNLEKASLLYTRLFNALPYKEETVESEQVRTMFYQIGETKLELLESLSTDSPIAKFIDKKGEGLHHIAFEVDDINQEMARLKVEGFHLLSMEPKLGADNKLVAFIHPKSAGGLLIELCQEIKKS